jgi:Zn-dependent protease with chaperone function
VAPASVSIGIVTVEPPLPELPATPAAPIVVTPPAPAAPPPATVLVPATWAAPPLAGFDAPAEFACPPPAVFGSVLEAHAAHKVDTLTTTTHLCIAQTLAANDIACRQHRWCSVSADLGARHSRHVLAHWDEQFLGAITAALQQDPDLPQERAEEIKAFYQQSPASFLCASDPTRLPDAFVEEACGDFRQLGWIGQASLGSALLGVLSVLVSVACVSLSFVSRQAQYVSFVAGWYFLRLASAVQVLAQGFVAVMLSFWVTAYFFEVYYIKLVGLVGIVAVMAAGFVIKAIFKRPDDKLAVEGERLHRDKSPALWARIDAICSQLQTAPPNHVVGGIDNNFFVTEHPVRASGQKLEGRTLFVSLSLLKRLDKPEADAILAHEMAHFSGGDTLYSKKLAPQLARFGQYMTALASGIVSIPIAYFMLFYWSMFQLSLNKAGRERELRADTLAAEATSPQSVANALLKVSAYSSYRGRVENKLFERDRAHSELNIAHSVAVGFTEYVKGPALASDLEAEDAFPHPFDSHPSLTTRLENVGMRIIREHVPEIVSSTASRTWFNEIGDAERIETELWNAYQARFRAAHEESLVYRYRPSTPEERAVVERVYPPVVLAGKKNGPPLTVDCLQINYGEWSKSVAWTSIKDMDTSEIPFVGKAINIRYQENGAVEKCSIPLHKLEEKDDIVIATINRYYARAMAAKQYAASTT